MFGQRASFIGINFLGLAIVYAMAVLAILLPEVTGSNLAAALATAAILLGYFILAGKMLRGCRGREYAALLVGLGGGTALIACIWMACAGTQVS